MEKSTILRIRLKLNQNDKKDITQQKKKRKRSSSTSLKQKKKSKKTTRNEKTDDSSSASPINHVSNGYWTSVQLETTKLLLRNYQFITTS